MAAQFFSNRSRGICNHLIMQVGTLEIQRLQVKQLSLNPQENEHKQIIQDQLTDDKPINSLIALSK